MPFHYSSMVRVCSFLCLLFIALSLGAQHADTVRLEKYFVVNKVTISGNSKTKERILHRELTFKAGDTIYVNDLSARLKRSEFNLMNTSLFLFVRIDTIPFFQHLIDIHVDVKERWYLFPVPIFEFGDRNFNTWLESPGLDRASYGFYLTDENFRGRKENLSFKIKFGYAEQFAFSYYIPFVNQRQTSGFSFGANFNRNQEIWFKTSNNKLVFFKDPGEYIRKEIGARISYIHRKGLYNSQSIELRYVKAFIADTVLKYTPDYFVSKQDEMQFFVLNFGFNFDHRDWKTYPLKGYYIGADITKQGLGILSDESINFLSYSATYRQYIQLYKKIYFAGMLKGRVSSAGFQPYYIHRALGYSDYVRGYQLYVIDGQSYFLGKANLKYELIKPRVFKINYLKTEKFNTIPYSFYLNFFADAGYVEDYYTYRNNPLANSWLIGYGLGIDFVTYYDNVIRFEYAVNRKGEEGFYLHLMSAF